LLDGGSWLRLLRCRVGVVVDGVVVRRAAKRLGRRD